MAKWGYYNKAYTKIKKSKTNKKLLSLPHGVIVAFLDMDFSSAKNK